MHALTKLFVVLLVICSLLLVAAIVVFVNRSDDFRKERDTVTTKWKQSELELNTARSSEQAVRQQIAALHTFYLASIQQLKEQLTAASTNAAGLNSQIADLKKQLQGEQAKGTSMVEQIANLTKTLNATQTALDDTRKRANELLMQKGDQEIRLAQLVKEVQILQKTNEISQEKIETASRTIQDLRKLVPEGKMSVENHTHIPAGPVSGVIKTVKLDHGIWYASINVGLADHVEKGMQFKIVGPAGDFMGLLTVDAVEANEAVGRLEGANPAAVKSDMKVATQL